MSPEILEGTTDNREDLTRAEQRYLERAAEAQQQGLTLEQYYRARGLSVGWLYNIRRQLQGKGVVVCGGASCSRLQTLSRVAGLHRQQHPVAERGQQFPPFAKGSAPLVPNAANCAAR
jgi:hypothetical protein